MPPIATIEARVQKLVLDMYGEDGGYTLGEEGFLVDRNTEFPTILKLKNKRALMDEVHRRYDACQARGIKTVLSRPPRFVASSSVKQLKKQLQSIQPSVLRTSPEEQMELQQMKAELRAIQAVVRNSDKNIRYGDACTAIWDAMESVADSFEGSGGHGAGRDVGGRDDVAAGPAGRSMSSSSSGLGSSGGGNSRQIPESAPIRLPAPLPTPTTVTAPIRISPVPRNVVISGGSAPEAPPSQQSGLLGTISVSPSTIHSARLDEIPEQDVAMPDKDEDSRNFASALDMLATTSLEPTRNSGNPRRL